MNKVYIVNGKRTPIGSMMGDFKDLTAIELAVETVKEILKENNIDPNSIQECIYGNVLSSGLKQSPCRQISILSGISTNAQCWNLNKLCASGLKAITQGALSIMANQSDVVMCGGFESMTNAPGLLLKQRFGQKVGQITIQDSLFYDGLQDALSGKLMGVCGEKTAQQYNITREMQDEYCIRSYERSIQAQKEGWYKKEIVEIKRKDGKIINEDQEPKKYKKEKIKKIKPVFDKSEKGSITGANASKISDGACSILLMNEQSLQKYNQKALVEIIAFADAEVEPIDFNIAPAKAISKLLEKRKMKIQDIDYWEINEAFSVTPIITSQMLKIDIEKINIHGGAVSLGHPVGMSGARILLSLINVLKRKNGKYGIAAICNGGGGATAILIRNVEQQ